MFGGTFSVGEEAGGFDDDVNAEVFPGEEGGVFDLEVADGVAVDGDGVFVGTGDFGLESAEIGVEFEEVGGGFVVTDVVDNDYVERGAFFQVDAEDLAADASEAVDGYFWFRHFVVFVRVLLIDSILA